MIQDDIWKKRQRLEECEDNYRRSCKKIRSEEHTSELQSQR